MKKQRKKKNLIEASGKKLLRFAHPLVTVGTVHDLTCKEGQKSYLMAASVMLKIGKPGTPQEKHDLQRILCLHSCKGRPDGHRCAHDMHSRCVGGLPQGNYRYDLMLQHKSWVEARSSDYK